MVALVSRDAGGGLSRCLRAHSCQGRPSSDDAEDILVEQNPTSLGERKRPSSKGFETAQPELPFQGFAGHLAAAPARAARFSLEHISEFLVEPESQGCTLHAMHFIANYVL